MTLAELTCHSAMALLQACSLAIDRGIELNGISKNIEEDNILQGDDR